MGFNQYILKPKYLMQSSYFRVAVAAVFLVEAIQSKNDKRKKITEQCKADKILASRRNQRAPATKLLPYETILLSSKTEKQQGLTLIYSKLVQGVFGVASDKSQKFTLCSMGLVQSGSSFLAWKLAQIPDNLSSPACVILHALQVVVVVALTLYLLFLQTEPKAVEIKIGSITAVLLLSEYLQHQTEEDVFFSIANLICIQVTVTAYILLEGLVQSLKWHDKAQSRSQDVVNRLASAMFEDQTISELGPGYGLLHYDLTEQIPEFCLLRYNQWFEKVLQCCINQPKNQFDSKEDDKNQKHGAESIFQDKKAMTYRLLNQLACKVEQESSKINSGSDSLVSPRALTLKSLLSNILTTIDKNGQKDDNSMNLLVQNVFQCESLQNNIGARSILKREKHCDIQISVVQLCPKSKILLVKVHRLVQDSQKMAICLPKISNSKLVPRKKVSFNSVSRRSSINENADYIENLHDREQSQQAEMRCQLRRQRLLKSAKSADDIYDVSSQQQSSSPKPSIDNLNDDEDGGDAKVNSQDNVEEQKLARNDQKSDLNEKVKAAERVFNYQDLQQAQRSQPASNQDSKEAANESAQELSLFSQKFYQKRRPLMQIKTVDLTSLDSMQLLQSPLNEIKEEFTASQSISIESEAQHQDKGFGNDTSQLQQDNNLGFMERLPFLEACQSNDKKHGTEIISSKPKISGNDKKWGADTEHDSNNHTVYPSDEVNHTNKITITSDKMTPSSHLSFNSMNLISSEGLQSQAKSLRAPSLSPRFSQSHRKSSQNVSVYAGDASSNKRFLMYKKKRSLFFPGSPAKKKSKTVLLSDKFDQVSKKLNSESQSILSMTSQKVKNNRIFVYKIIHDLRHPSDALSQGLSQLITDLNISQFKRDMNLRMSEETMSFKYVGQTRIRRALKSLKNKFSKQNSNQKRQLHGLLGSGSSRRLSSEVCSSESPSKGVSLDQSKSQPLLSDRYAKSFQCQRKKKKNPSYENSIIQLNQNQNHQKAPKSNQSHDSSPLSQSKSSSLLPKENAKDQAAQSSWQSRMFDLQKSWLKIDMAKIENFKAADKEIIISKDDNLQESASKKVVHAALDAQPKLIEEEKKEPQRKAVYANVLEDRQNGSDKEAGHSVSNSVSSIEQQEILSHDSEILCDINDEQMCEGSIAQSAKYSSTTPQKKVFQRESVSDIVSEKMNNDPSIRVPKYKHYSLAVDRLVYNEQARLSGDMQSLDVQAQRERANSNQIPSSGGQLNDIFQVMDRFKRQSNRMSQQNGNSQQNSKKLSHENIIFRLQKEKKNDFQSNQKVRSPIQSMPNVKKDNLSRFQYESDDHNKKQLFSEEVKSFNFSSQVNKEEIHPIQSEHLNNDIKPCDLDCSRKFSKMKQDFGIIVIEREYLVAMVDKMLQKTQKVNDKLVGMEAQAQMMMTLLRDLMNQAMMANNTFTMQKDYFDITQLIKRSLGMLQTQASIKNVRLIGPVIPNPIDKYYFQSIYVDELRYSQFIINFLSNSIKFTQSGGEASVHLKITQISEVDQMISNEVKRRESHDLKRSRGELQNSESSRQSINSAPDKELNPSQDHNNNEQPQPRQSSDINDTGKSNGITCKLIQFQMIFRDSGCGISSEMQKKLFQNFGKLQESQDVNKTGVGLGLSICKEIIMAHGGTVNIQSQKGIGTDFIITMSAKCIVDESRIALAKQRINTHGYCSSSSSSDDTQKRQAKLAEQSDEFSDDIESETYDSEEDQYSMENHQNGSDLHFYSSKQLNKHMRSAKQNHNADSMSPKDSIANKRDKQQPDELMQSMLKPDKSLFTIYEGSCDDVNENLTYKASRCLLANDNIFLLHGFEQTLKQHFTIVDIAENGLEALNMFLSKSADYYSCIVLDIQMPIMDGIEACQKMIEHLQQSKSVIMKQQKSQSSVRDQSQKSDQKMGRNEVSSFSAKTEIWQYPFIYALTSECEPQVIQQIKQAGFKQIFGNLDQEMLRIILTQAGLPFNKVKPLNHSDVIQMDFDEPIAESQRRSSNASKGQAGGISSSNQSSFSQWSADNEDRDQNQSQEVLHDRKASSLSLIRQRSLNNSFC